MNEGGGREGIGKADWRFKSLKTGRGREGGATQIGGEKSWGERGMGERVKRSSRKN